jgi:AcrR family transcriptional regulator
MNERSVRGARTKLRIIRAAADLFHQKGARATAGPTGVTA